MIPGWAPWMDAVLFIVFIGGFCAVIVLGDRADRRKKARDEADLTAIADAVREDT